MRNALEFTGDYEHAGGSFGANDGLELCIFLTFIR